MSMALRFKIFERFPDVKYGISEKTDGAVELANADLNNAKNRRSYFQKQGVDASEVISAGLTHSTMVAKVTDSDRGKIIVNRDGLITSGRDLFLTVTVADCFPVYFYNSTTGQVCLVHSGWRGTAENIVGKAIGAMSADPSDILVGIGPGIQECHFEIKQDILENFSEYSEAIIYRGDRIFVDLPKIISAQLAGAGVPQKNIENNGECTCCKKEKYFSFRRDKPKNVEAMVAYIGLKP